MPDYSAVAKRIEGFVPSGLSGSFVMFCGASPKKNGGVSQFGRSRFEPQNPVLARSVRRGDDASYFLIVS
jgi:hypothetical protein